MDELTVEWVDGKSLRQDEPDLSPEVRCGVISRDEQSIHPGRFTQALARGAIGRGAQIRTGCPVTAIRHREGRFLGVTTPEGEIDAGELLIAAGAWSRVPCAWLGIDVPISPCRGQMLSLRPDAASLSRPLFSYNGAVLPKPDGTIHVGATVELVGFDTRTTAGGIATVLEIVPRLVPGLSEAVLENTWSGLRPWCEDGIPAIGRLPGCQGISLASGHFKMGILGSPITARTVRRLVVDNVVDPLIAPFSPSRFSEIEA
jgi:glycine oxidase